MDHNHQDCALLRPSLPRTEMPANKCDIREAANRPQVERLRIERDRAHKHARCAILQRHLEVAQMSGR